MTDNQQAAREWLPIINTKERVPFALVEPFNKQAVRNHGQTLNRLAERGGVSWVELVAIVEGWNLHECDMKRRPWPRTEDAKRRVMAILDRPTPPDSGEK